MKTKMQSACLVLIAAGMILTSSCSKTGPAGPAGAAGTNGTNGNANVIETTFYNQGLSYIAANADYEVTLTMPEITSVVLNKGAILVYTQTVANPTQWIQLPASIGSVQFNVTDNVGNVNVACTNASSANFNFKVVVIPQ